MRIERHEVGEARLAAATADFAERVGKDVHMMQHDPMPAEGWTMVAETFLDYLGARSVHDPDLTGRDAEVAFRSASAAGVGSLLLRTRFHRPHDIFVDYTGVGASYGPEREDDTGGPSPSDWLDAFWLAFLAGTSETAAEGFIEAASAWRERPPRPDIALVHALLLYTYGCVPPGGPAGVPAPSEDAGRCALIDTLIARLGPGDDFPRQRAALTTLRAIAATDEDAFGEALAAQLSAHRAHQHAYTAAGGSPGPGTLLPLAPIALAAMARQWHGIRPGFESDYLPAALVTAFATGAPRVAAHGRDKRPDAVAALAAGPLAVSRPPHPYESGAEPLSWYDEQADEAMARFRDRAQPPGRRPARPLLSLMSAHRARFLARAAADPRGDDSGLYESLALAAEAGAAALRLARAEPGTQVEVAIGVTVRMLPGVHGEDEPSAHHWRVATSAALAVGARKPLADCVLMDPAFLDADTPTPASAYSAALHDYLRGAEPEGALDRAAALTARAGATSAPPPPVVLLSQLVQGDREGFALALADALEEYRDHYSVADRGNAVEAAASIDILGLACHARRIGWPVPVVSPYLPRNVF
ncbi:immunity 49 family protein [Streptomyces sp. NPDC050560]|uniref:immunity 49 family protein n=1 Tax=Streptomyces sp. NPDC050560 TaxID=3365630 RepID=UPI0037BD478C